MNIFLGDDARLRPIWRFLVAIVVAFVANLGASLFASIFGQGRFFELVFRPTALTLLLVGFSFLTVVVDQSEGNPLAQMGLSFHAPWLRDATVGMLFGFLMIVAAVTTIIAVVGISFRSLISPRTPILLIADLIILASAAMLEEVLFRGYPFQRLVESIGPAPATVVLSGLFGAVHLSNSGATLWSTLNTAAVGVLFCVAYLRTRSLWMPWGLHFAWNTTLGLVFGLPVSGMKSFAVLVRGTANGPVWLTGGKYGIEGSALGLAIICAGILLILRFVKPRTITTHFEAPPDQHNDLLSFPPPPSLPTASNVNG